MPAGDFRTAFVTGVYGAVSREIMRIFREVTPEVEPLSLDEAFLDVGGAIRRLGPPAHIAALIRAGVRGQQGITCSVGVATCKFVAKLASTLSKPDGLLVVPADQVLDFLHPLPVAALWGVGEQTGQALARLGLRTVGDIAHTPEDTLQRELGAAAGAHLAALAWGRDERPVVSRPDKSIGAEETFATDVDDPAVIRRELCLRLSGRTAQGLRAGGYVARTRSGRRSCAWPPSKNDHAIADAARADRCGQKDLRHCLRALRGLGA